jgi:PAS domain S-box-containing protein
MRVLSRDRRRQGRRAPVALYKMVVDNADDLIAVSAEDGTILFASPSWERSLGYETEEIVGRNGLDFVHPDDVESARIKMADGFAEGRASLAHLRLRHKDGRWIDFEGAGSLISDEDGAPLILAVSRNITDRLKLDAERNRLAAIVESSSDAIISKTLDGIITSWNTEAERLYGYDAAEAIGHPITMIVPPHLHEEVRGFLERVRNGERIPHAETVRIRKDGTSVDVAITISPIRGENGTIVGASTVARDLTERRNAERADRQSMELRQQMGAIVDSALDCIVSMGHDATIIEFNPAAERTFGYRREDVIGRPLAELIIPPSLRQQHIAGFANYLRTGEGPVLGKHVELRAMRRDGSEFPVELSIVRVNLPGPPIFTGFIRDITRRKQAEEERERLLERERNALLEVQRLNSELEDRVAERTAQLENAVEELEAFSYSVSHDLRAPLRAIDGFAGILEQELGPRLDTTSAPHLHTVRRQARRMGQLIDDLLAFAKLSRLPLSRRAVDVDALVRNCLEDLAPALADRECQFNIGELPPCQGDQALLQQVFFNLLANAVKFTVGRDVAHIEVGTLEGSSPTVYFVRDDGAGFDMAYKDKLFGVFQRLHREDEFEGTGVGLAMVERVVRRHGGKVWAEAAVGTGATFFLTLEEEAPG